MRVMRKQIDACKVPKGRVELHLHLDGAVRISTVWELAKRKNVPIGESTSYEHLVETLRVNRQASLENFLSGFSIFTPIIAGDADAIERCAYELCEDQAKQGCSYFETRYSPHLWTSKEAITEKSTNGLSCDKVVEAVISGLNRGEKDFGIKARSILCCIYQRPDWSDDVFRLCQKYRLDGVVGIDCAAGEPENSNYDKQIVQAFVNAKDAGIHRTCHAGETNNSCKNVELAMKELFAERIGHGYHVVDDPNVYELCKQLHFETCPHSSYFTGAVSSSANNGKHPIVQFAEDNLSFSISKDDPTIIQTTLDDEYRYLFDLGLTEAHLIRANINAAKASFLPDLEKKQLINDILTEYGLNNGYNQDQQ